MYVCNSYNQINVINCNENTKKIYTVFFMYCTKGNLFISFPPKKKWRQKLSIFFLFCYFLPLFLSVWKSVSFGYFIDINRRLKKKILHRVEILFVLINSMILKNI